MGANGGHFPYYLTTMSSLNLCLAGCMREFVFFAWIPVVQVVQVVIFLRISFFNFGYFNIDAVLFELVF